MTLHRWLVLIGFALLTVPGKAQMKSCIQDCPSGSLLSPPYSGYLPRIAAIPDF
jgi:hypothetical protein